MKIETQFEVLEQTKSGIITSVRRLSDDLIFNLHHEYSGVRYETIRIIEFKDNKCVIHFETLKGEEVNGAGVCSINDLIKIDGKFTDVLTERTYKELEDKGYTLF